MNLRERESEREVLNNALHCIHQLSIIRILFFFIFKSVRNDFNIIDFKIIYTSDDCRFPEKRPMSHIAHLDNSLCITLF